MVDVGDGLVRQANQNFTASLVRTSPEVSMPMTGAVEVVVQWLYWSRHRSARTALSSRDAFHCSDEHSYVHATTMRSHGGDEVIQLLNCLV
jgi:hypothetical protein